MDEKDKVIKKLVDYIRESLSYIDPYESNSNEAFRETTKFREKGEALVKQYGTTS